MSYDWFKIKMDMLILYIRAFSLTLKFIFIPSDFNRNQNREPGWLS